MKGKKAVSPVISTTLLILIVIILAIIIILWGRGFISEAITKEIAGNEKRVNELCSEVKMTGIINEDDSFGFENTGNVPIFSHKLILDSGDKSDVVNIETDASLIAKEKGGYVNPGYGSIAEGYVYSNYESIKIVPILLGKAGTGTKEFECPEIHGLEIK